MRKNSEAISKCFICGSASDVRTLSVPTKSFDENAQRRILTIASCRTCGYERNLAVRTADDAIRLQSHFDLQVTEVDIAQTRWPARAKLVATKINKLVPGGGRALDIGCNTGTNLRALGSHWQRVGVEMSVPLAQAAARFVPAEVHVGPFEEFAASPGSFDLVMAHAVIEHIYDPVGFLTRIHELLRPDGLVVVMTGDRESQVARQMGDYWPLYVSPDHVSYFSARSIRHLFERVGFDVVAEDWRFMYFKDGIGSRLRRALVKLSEIADVTSVPRFDAYYVYARKRTSA
jgi:SAM-dependent methyltransferase